MTDWAFRVVIAGFCVITFSFIGMAIYTSIQHQRDLERNGCREQVRAKTGKRILVGKISRDEEVIVYECANGRRVEFR
jgi:hypothetical protein